MIEGIIPYANCNDLKFSTAMFAAMYLACLTPGYSQSLGKKRILSLAPPTGESREIYSMWPH